MLAMCILTCHDIKNQPTKPNWAEYLHPVKASFRNKLSQSFACRSFSLFSLSKECGKDMVL